MLLDNSKSNSGREKTSVVTGNATDLQPQKKKKKTKKMKWCASPWQQNLKYKGNGWLPSKLGLLQSPTIMYK